jgi:hypothetical protein
VPNYWCNRQPRLKPAISVRRRSASPPELSEAQTKNGTFPSVWVVIGRNSNDLGNLVTDSRWKPSVAKPGAKVWTDDFSSVISIFKWR